MDAKARQSVGVRVAVGVAGLALAVFFGAIGIAILLASKDPKAGPLETWAIRAFVVLVFGGISALGLSMVVGAVRGPATPGGRLPEALCSRCPACGEAVLHGACSACGGAAELREAWTEQPRDLAAPFFLGVMGGALLVLSVIVALGGAVEEKRLLFVIAYGALAILLLVGALAFVYGAVTGARDAWRARKRRSFVLHFTRGHASVDADATVDGGALSMRGGTRRTRPLDAMPDEPMREPVLTPQGLALARVLAVLHARGEIGLAEVRTTRYALAPSGSIERSEDADVAVSASWAGDEAVDARDVVLRTLSDRDATYGVRILLSNLYANPELAGAFDAFQRRLPLELADPRTLRILGQLLDEGPSGTPYRNASA